eukprot:CAMPEP_0203866342 /NCGR_PEP_ID=MMETSP0359-20131031/15891_1 /ASSEMBLY_ACC=CAM_ASM_000338 /TAXON_ID=268821 /ORGANISM="Scrippsiella Hangoei, Strain SHTV-5" /LENGTH=265 /DNA_ID=CAMNT_0050784415 /DNA_START=175 /DNA_END=971 /DNA_ORIENTATION=+
MSGELMCRCLLQAGGLAFGWMASCGPSAPAAAARRGSGAAAAAAPLALEANNLRRCRYPLPLGLAPSVLGSIPGWAIVKVLGERGWGLQDAMAEQISAYLRIDFLKGTDTSITGCSSYRGDYPIEVALNSKEDEWWISEAGSMPGGVGREFLAFSFGAMPRRVSFVGVRIPPMPSGPLSVRNFHLEVPPQGTNTETAAGLDVWCMVPSTSEFRTLDNGALQEFALVPPLETTAVRLVCTRNAASASSSRDDWGPDCIGLFQVAFA